MKQVGQRVWLKPSIFIDSDEPKMTVPVITNLDEEIQFHLSAHEIAGNKKTYKDILIALFEDESIWMKTAVKVDEIDIAIQHAEKIVNVLYTLKQKCKNVVTFKQLNMKF